MPTYKVMSDIHGSADCEVFPTFKPALAFFEKECKKHAVENDLAGVVGGEMKNITDQWLDQHDVVANDGEHRVILTKKVER